MRKNINLLYSKEEGLKRLKIQKITRVGSFIAGFVVLLIVGVVFFLNAETKSQYLELTSQKEFYLQKHINNSDKIARINILANKLEFIKNVYANERDYEKHIKLLKELIPTSTQSALINSINFTKDVGLEFDIQFNDYDEAYSFLRLIESGKINDLFTNIVVKNVKVTELNGPQINVTFSAEYKKDEE